MSPIAPDWNHSFFGDLVLPKEVQRQIARFLTPTPVPVVNAPPPVKRPRINWPRTCRQALARQIAMRRPKRQEVEAAIAEAATYAADEVSLEAQAARARRTRIEGRYRNIPAYVENLDRRYRIPSRPNSVPSYEYPPAPAGSAVLFCLMDSCTDKETDKRILAKGFFVLQYLILKQRYQSVEVVYIPNIHDARETNDKSFFAPRPQPYNHIVPALAKATQIIWSRYRDREAYVVQVSDGDNFDKHPEDTRTAMQNLLSLCSHFVYAEIVSKFVQDRRKKPGVIGVPPTSLWKCYAQISSGPFSRCRVDGIGKIRPAFPDKRPHASVGSPFVRAEPQPV